jgi:hypothetical protein
MDQIFSAIRRSLKRKREPETEDKNEACQVVGIEDQIVASQVVGVEDQNEDGNFFFFLNFTYSTKFGHFCKYSPNVQNSHLTPMNFQLLSIWTNPYKLGHQIFEKDQNTHDFYFFKKKKKKNILEVEILNSEF